MAEIDGSNPIQPVWPKRPGRKLEGDEERERDKRRRRPRKEEEKDNRKDDGRGSHIDEYV